MKMICTTSLVAKIDFDAFHYGIMQEIQEMQEEGFEVDIQYSIAIDEGCPYYSALVIGRAEVATNEEIEFDKN